MQTIESDLEVREDTKPQEATEMKEEGENEIGMNIASFLPQAVFAGHLEGVSLKLKEQGYQFLSAIPLRSLRNPSGVDFHLPIWYVERAWNPTEFEGLEGLLEVIASREDPQATQLQDWIASPSRVVSNNVYEQLLRMHSHPKTKRPTVIVHDFYHARYGKFSVNTIIEIHPGIMGILEEVEVGSPELIAERIQEQQQEYPNIEGVDLDTKHMRRGLRPDESARLSLPGQPVRETLGAWERTLEVLYKHTRLVDFQASDNKELYNTLDGRATELNDIMNAFLSYGYRGPIRVEFSLGLPGLLPGNQLAVAGDIRAYLKDKFNIGQ